MWILTFDGTQSWCDLVLLPICDTVALCFNLLVFGWVQIPAGVCAPRAGRVLRPVYRWAFLGREVVFVPAPHPARFIFCLFPAWSGLGLMTVPAWFGAGAGFGAAGWLGQLGGFGDGAEVVVALFDAARLDLFAAGLLGIVCGWVRAVGRMIWAFIRRLGGIIGAVGGHRTSQQRSRKETEPSR